MNLILLAICIAITFAAFYRVYRQSWVRKELFFIFISGVFLAYPLKAFLLSADSSFFFTFSDYEPAYNRKECYFAYITFVLLLSIGFLNSRRYQISSNLKAISGEGAWAYLNLSNAVLLLFFAVTFSKIHSLEELLSAAARREFLDAQQGRGWVSLLIVFSIPLLVLGRYADKFLIFWLSTIFAFIGLMIIGSRVYLFGYIIAFLMSTFTLSIFRTITILSALSIIGSLIYSRFLGLGLSTLSVLQMLQFLMHTFDGADILNSYILSGHGKIYYGSTILEDIFITYIPRAIWDNKPFLFGAIRITADIFPALRDVQALGATFPPGIFTELYANFGILALSIPLLLGKTIAWASNIRRNSANPFFFALYVSLCAGAPGFFRGIGGILAFAFPVVFLLSAIWLVNRLRL